METDIASRQFDPLSAHHHAPTQVICVQNTQAAFTISQTGSILDLPATFLSLILPTAL